MNTPNPSPSHSRLNVRFFLAAAVSSLVAVGALVLLMNIFERKQEAKNPFFRVVELTDEETDPAVWGKNFPMQYDDYRRTVDMVAGALGIQLAGAAYVPMDPAYPADRLDLYAEDSGAR
ncbi:MAG TPA: hypothetical protein PKN08_09325, partial [Opitutaceae bacterium]|nr:hypothetical protein [Opitutaceae bacterium]